MVNETGFTVEEIDDGEIETERKGHQHSDSYLRHIFDLERESRDAEASWKESQLETQGRKKNYEEKVKKLRMFIHQLEEGSLPMFEADDEEEDGDAE